MKPLSEMTDPEVAALCRSCANAVKSRLPTKTLFAILIFNEPGEVQYISNCPRVMRVELLREAADSLERRETIARESFPVEPTQ